jgi:hypothetical protein
MPHDQQIRDPTPPETVPARPNPPPRRAARAIATTRTKLARNNSQSFVCVTISETGIDGPQFCALSSVHGHKTTFSSVSTPVGRSSKPQICFHSIEVHHRYPEIRGTWYILTVSSYFLNETYSDAKIQVGDATVPAHRLVLCSQSEYFTNALEGGFSEGTQKVLTCPPHKEPAYMRMLQYLYTGNYSDEKSDLLDQEGAHETMSCVMLVLILKQMILSS